MTPIQTLARALLVMLLAALAPDAHAAEASLPSPPVAGSGATLPAITVARAESSQIVETIVVGGTLVAREEVMVAPEVDGLAVREILVEEGASVKKGDVLARLSVDQIEATLAQNEADIARWDAAIAQARTQIAEAQATRTENQKALKRAQKLNKSGFASEERLDQSESGAAVSQARLDSARQAVTSAEAQKKASFAQRRELEWRLSRTEVRAPVGGIVSARLARLGQIASIASGSLFRIIEGGDIELEAEVSDVAMPKLVAGQTALVAPAGFTEPVRGTVRLVSPEIDRTTRLGRVRIALPHDARLRIGGYARGTLEVERRTGITVPLSALSYGKNVAFLQIVQNAVVRTRPVQIGHVDGERAEVRSGVVAGEEIVARAGSFLRDGDRIVPVPVATEEASQ